MGAPTHRRSRTPTHNAWLNMRQRVGNPKHPDYQHYGARGVRVCARWERFENFLADMGEKPAGLTLDRWPDNDGDYAPGNCRWASPAEQSRNRRNNLYITHEGETLLLADWSRRLSIDAGTLRREWRRNGSLGPSIEGRK